MRIPFQMRHASKRSAIAASLVVLAAVFFWNSIRSRENSETRASATVQAAIVEESHPNSETKLIDSDNDGFPDIVELHTFEDRDSFRRWFAAIAETQFYQLSDQWNADQRDCAGLVRFATREALRKHDRIWFQKMGPNYETVAGDVGEFDLDHNPLGEKIFRTDFGSFDETDLRNGS